MPSTVTGAMPASSLDVLTANEAEPTYGSALSGWAQQSSVHAIWLQLFTCLQCEGLFEAGTGAGFWAGTQRGTDGQQGMHRIACDHRMHACLSAATVHKQQKLHARL